MEYYKYQEKLINNSLPIEDCWEWQGSTKGKSRLRSYGSCFIGSRTDGSRKSISTHRLSYLAFIGPIPEGMWVCHSCDNPKCVNPDHLFLGTRQDNVDDRQRKNRNRPPNGELHPRATLSNNVVMQIKSDYKNGIKRRVLAKKYNTTIAILKDIIRGRNWKSIN